MRSYFDDQLSRLNSELLMMGALCEDAISCAVKCLTESDPKMKEGAQSAECEIDRKEREIEQLCMKLLVRQQPVATDFRTVTAALKMISDMERIGDQSRDIAEIAEYVTSVGLQAKINVADMARAAVEMVTQSVNSFVRRDIETARSVAAMDDRVDSLFIKIKNELIAAVQNGHENAEALVDLLMIAKYFERIGDHAENIAEWVVYAITGEHKNLIGGSEKVIENPASM